MKKVLLKFEMNFLNISLSQNLSPPHNPENANGEPIFFDKKFHFQ